MKLDDKGKRLRSPQLTLDRSSKPTTPTYTYVTNNYPQSEAHIEAIIKEVLRNTLGPIEDRLAAGNNRYEKIVEVESKLDNLTRILREDIEVKSAANGSGSKSRTLSIRFKAPLQQLYDEARSELSSALALTIVNTGQVILEGDSRKSFDAESLTNEIASAFTDTGYEVYDLMAVFPSSPLVDTRDSLSSMESLKRNRKAVTDLAKQLLADSILFGSCAIRAESTGQKSPMIGHITYTYVINRVASYESIISGTIRSKVSAPAGDVQGLIERSMAELEALVPKELISRLSERWASGKFSTVLNIPLDQVEGGDEGIARIASQISDIVGMQVSPRQSADGKHSVINITSGLRAKDLYGMFEKMGLGLRISYRPDPHQSDFNL